MPSVFTPDCLAGKVAFVTGGHSGIGYGICQQLGRHGAKVCIFGRRCESESDIGIHVEAYC
jgi:peroxisomal 2,4-dienoyl-CoA reductase